MDADLLTDPSIWVEPPPELEDRVMAAVVAIADSEARAPTGAAPTLVGRGRSRHQVRRWAVPFLADAAAAGLAVGLVGAVAVERGQCSRS